MLLKLLLVPLLLYAAICLALFLMQTRAVFPAAAAGGAGPLPPRAERLDLVTPDGERLVGVHLSPEDPDPALPVVLAFGGNAWNAQDAAEYLAGLYPRADVIAFHYRGYQPSTGTPSARALLTDSLLVHDLAAPRFPGRRIVAVGFSIGSGIAAHLAGARPIAGAILVTPFDSLAAVAAGHYPWLPVRLLFRHRLDPAEALRGSRVPVAIVAGAHDTLIPPARTAALRKAVPNLVYDRVIAGAGHNDIYRSSAFQQAMDEALAKIVAS